MDATPQKRCPGCEETKALSHFGKDRTKPDGLNGYCRPCRNRISAEHRARNPDGVKKSLKKSKAKRKKEISAYNADYYARDREHHRRRAKGWREANPDKARAQAQRIPKAVKAARHKSWRARNLEHARRKRRENHFANHKASLDAIKDWKRRNPQKNAFYQMKRMAAKLQAIPSWADMKKIEAIYAEARRLTELTGIPHHVDHIVPLQSPWVCGLHCEANLQILPYYENQSKSNRHWPDMPDLTGIEPTAMAA